MSLSVGLEEDNAIAGHAFACTALSQNRENDATIAEFRFTPDKRFQIQTAMDTDPEPRREGLPAEHFFTKSLFTCRTFSQVKIVSKPPAVSTTDFRLR